MYFPMVGYFAPPKQTSEIPTRRCIADSEVGLLKSQELAGKVWQSKLTKLETLNYK